MDLRIETVEGGLRVTIAGVAGREPAVLEKLRVCRQSAWACPSGECLNIATMEQRAEDGRVLLALGPRPGEQLRAAAIEQCLRYMLHEFADPR